MPDRMRKQWNGCRRGFVRYRSSVHAMVAARVVVKPGQILTNATIIIRDGVHPGRCQGCHLPPDARIWDMKGLTVEAGFIDPYLTLGPFSGGKSEDKSRLYPIFDRWRNQILRCSIHRKPSLEE